MHFHVDACTHSTGIRHCRPPLHQQDFPGTPPLASPRFPSLAAPPLLTLMLWPWSLMMEHTSASRPILSWQRTHSVLTASPSRSWTVGAAHTGQPGKAESAREGKGQAWADRVRHTRMSANSL
jgi:hypothetical protein